MQRINQLIKDYEDFLVDRQTAEATAKAAWTNAEAKAASKPKPSAKAKKAVAKAKDAFMAIQAEIAMKKAGHPNEMAKAIEQWKTAVATEIADKERASRTNIAAEEAKAKANIAQQEAQTKANRAKAENAANQELAKAQNTAKTLVAKAEDAAKAVVKKATVGITKRETETAEKHKDVIREWNKIVERAAEQAIINKELENEARNKAKEWMVKYDTAREWVQKAKEAKESAKAYETWAKQPRGSGETMEAHHKAGTTVPKEGGAPKEGAAHSGGTTETQEGQKARQGGEEEQEHTQEGDDGYEERAAEEEKEPAAKRKTEEKTEKSTAKTSAFSIFTLAKDTTKTGGRVKVAAETVGDTLGDATESDEDLFGANTWMKAIKQKHEEEVGSPKAQAEFRKLQRNLPTTARMEWKGFHLLRKDIFKLSTVKLIKVIEADNGVPQALTALMLMQIISEGTASSLREWAATVPDKEAKDGLGFKQVRQIVASSWVQLLRDMDEEQESSREMDDEEVTRSFAEKLNQMVKKEWRQEFLAMVRRAREGNNIKNQAKQMAAGNGQKKNGTTGNPPTGNQGNQGNGLGTPKATQQPGAPMVKTPQPGKAAGGKASGPVARPSVCWFWLSEGNCTLQGCKFLHASSMDTMEFLAGTRGVEVTEKMKERARATESAYWNKMEEMNPGRVIIRGPVFPKASKSAPPAALTNTPTGS